MKSPLRSAILRGYDDDEQETPQQEAAEKAAAPPPKSGLGALAAAVGKGKSIKKVTIIGGGGGAGDQAKKAGPKHGDAYQYDSTLVWDAGQGKYVKRAALKPPPERKIYEK